MSDETEIDDEDLFRAEMTGVKPLKSSNRISHQPVHKKIRVGQHAETEMDRFEDLFSDAFPEEACPDVLSFCRSGVQHKLFNQLRAGKLAIEDVVDLHGLSVKEARAYLGNFKESNTFTNEEWIKIVQVLNLMDFAATGTEGYTEKVDKQKAAAEVVSERPITKRETDGSQLSKNKREIAELYYLSLAYYYAGQLGKAKEGLIKVLKNDSIPPAIAKTIKDDLANIDKNLSIRGQKRDVAELYYRSMAFYHAGQFEKAREGLVKVLKSGLVPEPMIKTIKDCLTNIDNTLNLKPPVQER